MHGTKLLQSGKIDEASRLFSEVLRADNKQADALHLLGIIKSIKGKQKEATRLIKKAIKLNPTAGVYHRNLGLILESMDRAEDAIKALKTAIRINSKDIKSYCELGVIYSKSNNIKKAIEAYKGVINIDRNNSQIYYNLGVLLEKDRRISEAVNSYKRAISLSPKDKDSYNNLGNIIKGQGNLDEAIVLYNKAIEIDPRHIEAHNGLGSVLEEKGNFDEAISAYKKAIEVSAEHIAAYNGLGNCLKEKGDLDKAMSIYYKSIKINPINIGAYNGIGNILMRTGEHKKAIRYYNKALSIDDTIPISHWNLSLALLKDGNFVDGWREYEWRWKRKDFGVMSKNIARKLWRGEPISGKRLFLFPEQGNGDTIQFIRYVIDILENNKNVYILVECQQSLFELLLTFSGNINLYIKGDVIPDFDVCAPLMSLPYILKSTVSSIPSHIPYLFSGPNKINFECSRSKINIGIVWAGAAQHKNDKNRSIQLSYFIDIASLDNVRLFSLQIGDRSADLEQVGNDLITDMSEQIDTYADTAAIIEKLDLVISVDTSVAHLAGAMGKAIWLLLPFAADFRWMTDRDDTPWYNSMRLFRQKTIGNWGDVFNEVKKSID